MVKKSLQKTIFREIRDSLSRYLAIVGIIALGAGFFTGLKVTNTAMIHTGDKYLNDTCFYDYRLLSTLGWEKDSVEDFAAAEHCSLAEGSVSTDALVEIGEKQIVVQAMTRTSSTNKAQLTEGRWPTAANECVIDDYCLGAISIGDKIIISESNDEDTAEMFRYKVYYVVGAARSPLYINFERGNTDLGDGTISAFILIEPDGFDTDYYTEVYLRMDNTDYIYSDGYEDFIEEQTDPITSLSKQIAYKRYRSVKDEAQEKWNDAKQEYDDGAEEIAQAWQDLYDYYYPIKDDLLDQRKALWAKQAELNAQRPQLVSGIEQAEETLADLKLFPEPDAEKTAQIAQLEAQIPALKTQLTTLDAGLVQIEDGLEQIEDGIYELDDAYFEVADEIHEAEEELEDAAQELADAQQEIDDIELPDVYVLDRSTNVGYVCFESDADIVSGIAKVFPFFFFAVAALVCITTMNRMVDDERGQIGIMKALGYHEGDIMSRYLIYTGSASLIGCAVGVIAGSYIFPTAIWQAYGIMYSMPSISLVFDIGLMLLSGFSYLILAMAVTYFSCRKELREPAAELIRPKSPPPGKRIWLEHFGFIWKRLKFLHKVSLRNVFRYQKRFIMMVLGIGGCTALLLTGLGLNDSITDIANKQYEQISIYDADVNFSEDMRYSKEAFLEECGDAITDCAFLYSANLDCKTDSATGSVTLNAVEQWDEFTNLMDFHTSRGKEPLSAPGKGQCIVSENVAKRYGLSVGDSITLTQDSIYSITLEISGIYENVIYNYVCTEFSNIQGKLPDMPFKSALLNLNPNMDLHEAGAVITGAENVTNVTLCEDMLLRINNMLSSMKYVVILVIACAAALAFVVLFNLSNINIHERIREIATIKVLGFRSGETGQYVFRENLLLTFCGCLLGIPLGIWLHNYVINQIKIDMISFVATRKPVSYLISIALTFVFTFIVNLIMKPKLDKINMAEALKSVE